MANWNEQTEQRVCIRTNSPRRVASGSISVRLLSSYFSPRLHSAQVHYLHTDTAWLLYLHRVSYRSSYRGERERERERTGNVAKRNTGGKILAIVSKLVCPRTRTLPERNFIADNAHYISVFAGISRKLSSTDDSGNFRFDSYPLNDTHTQCIAVKYIFRQLCIKFEENSDFHSVPRFPLVADQILL